MNQNITSNRADPNDPEIQRKIARNCKVAHEAYALIVKRHRKLEPIEAFEAAMNTIGVLAAECMRDAAMIDLELVPYVHACFLEHLSNASKKARGS